MNGLGQIIYWGRIDVVMFPEFEAVILSWFPDAPPLA